MSSGVGAPGKPAAARRIQPSHTFGAIEFASASGLPLTLQRGVPVLLQQEERVAKARFSKRLLDLALALPAMVALAPIFLAVAVAVKLTSPGPVLFRQERVGYRGAIFSILKFRTLRVERADPSGVDQVHDDDRDRFTPIGQFLRRSSLDELPQLINVIRGDMSLVGPRPHVAGQLADGRPYEELVSYYRLRTTVKPGLTGWAQANGLRGSTDDPVTAKARIDHDLAYIQNASVFLDLRIMMRTLQREVLGGRSK